MAGFSRDKILPRVSIGQPPFGDDEIASFVIGH